MDIKTAKTISLNQTLKLPGYSPSISTCHHEVWYLSPFRDEKTLRFKVKDDHIWYDHVEGCEGTIIDFGLRYRRTSSVKEVLSWLSQFTHAEHQKKLNKSKQSQIQDRRIRIVDARPITSRALLNYLKQDRRIDPFIATSHLKEVEYCLGEKTYFALGFPNRSGGWELRNAFFKAGSSPKDVSLIKSPHNHRHGVSVFEGFMDFLTVLTQHRSKYLSQDVIVLNSLALQERAIGLIHEKTYDQVHTFMDNDAAGQKATQAFSRLTIPMYSQNHLYEHHKDVNDHHLQTLDRGSSR